MMAVVVKTLSCSALLHMNMDFSSPPLAAGEQSEPPLTSTASPRVGYNPVVET